MAQASRAGREYAAVRDASKETTEPLQPAGFFVGKVVDVYDGDTCRLAVAVPPVGATGAAGAPAAETAVRYLRVRTLGYDAPEMKKDHRPYGLEVKAVLERLVLGKIVVAYIPVPRETAGHGLAVPSKNDPYGRVLAHLFVAERGARFPVPVAPPPPSRLARCFSCCGCRRRAPSAGERSMLVTAVADGSGAREETPVTVRGLAVRVPCTANVPCEFGRNFAETAQLIHVNQWMLDHGRVKAYDGKASREGYTPDELAHGVAAGGE